MKQEILSAIKAGKDFDYIANNYHALSKSGLADVYKELSYSIYTFLSKEEYARFLAHYADTLDENISDE